MKLDRLETFVLLATALHSTQNKMLHSRQTHYDIIVPRFFFSFASDDAKIFEKLCVLSKMRLIDWEEKSEHQQIYTHSLNSNNARNM